MKIPVFIKTNEDRLKFLYRTVELLRLEHNERGRQFREGLISEKEFRNYQKYDFEPRNQKLFFEINNLKEKLDLVRDYSGTPEGSPNLEKAHQIKEEGKKETKWDKEIDISKIESIGNPSISEDPTEDFTTYTEVDPNNHISRTASRITFTNLSRNEDAYVYSDKGANHFDGDFEFLLTSYFDSSTDYYGLFCVALANIVDDINGIQLANGDFLGVLHHLYNPQGDEDKPALRLRECDGGTLYTDNLFDTLSLDTPYYLIWKRDESVGTYGTEYLYVYSDADRTNLLTTLSITLHSSKKDFRYIYGVNTYNSGDAYSISGYVENLDLQEVSGYTLTAEYGDFTLTGITSGLLKASKLTAETGTFVLTGIASGLSKGFRLIAETGNFVLTGISAGLSKGLSIIAETGTFVLTGISSNLSRIFKLIAGAGNFILTGIATVLRYKGWKYQTKHTTNWTEETKHTSSWAEQTKHTTLWTNQDKF